MIELARSASARLGATACVVAVLLVHGCAATGDDVRPPSVSESATSPASLVPLARSLLSEDPVSSAPTISAEATAGTPVRMYSVRQRSRPTLWEIADSSHAATLTVMVPILETNHEVGFFVAESVTGKQWELTSAYGGGAPEFERYRRATNVLQNALGPGTRFRYVWPFGVSSSAWVALVGKNGEEERVVLVPRSTGADDPMGLDIKEPPAWKVLDADEAWPWLRELGFVAGASR
jgi:hypothetical protein